MALPVAFRAQFVEGFSRAAKSGLEVGSGHVRVEAPGSRQTGTKLSPE
jgi:hypothetical protein